MCEMIEDVQNLQRRVDSLTNKLQALLDYQELAFEYEPEKYNVVKAKDLKLQEVTMPHGR